MQLEYLQQFNLKSLIDIGAHISSFYGAARSVLSLQPSDCMVVEANKACEPNLKNLGVEYRIVMLSNVKGTRPYFKAKHNSQCTGNSYYKEISQHYRDENLEVDYIETDTLDNITSRNYDLIKLDTQGSELDILRGGPRVLSNAKAVLIETSIVPYNENAPLQDEVIAFMASNGFKVNKIMAEDCRLDINLHQQDLLFIRS